MDEVLKIFLWKILFCNVKFVVKFWIFCFCVINMVKNKWIVFSRKNDEEKEIEKFIWNDIKWCEVRKVGMFRLIRFLYVVDGL